MSAERCSDYIATCDRCDEGLFDQGGNLMHFTNEPSDGTLDRHGWCYDDHGDLVCARCLDESVDEMGIAHEAKGEAPR